VQKRGGALRMCGGLENRSLVALQDLQLSAAAHNEKESGCTA
jgi:hypothetical protein